MAAHCYCSCLATKSKNKGGKKRASPPTVPALWGNMRLNGDHDVSGTRNRVQLIACTSIIDAMHTGRSWPNVVLAGPDPVVRVAFVARVALVPHLNNASDRFRPAPTAPLAAAVARGHSWPLAPPQPP
jgi:hypothetical protein